MPMSQNALQTEQGIDHSSHDNRQRNTQHKTLRATNKASVKYHE